MKNKQKKNKTNCAMKSRNFELQTFGCLTVGGGFLKAKSYSKTKNFELCRISCFTGKSCAFYEDVFPIPGNLKEYSIVY